MSIRVAGPSDVEALFDVRTSVGENHQSREELAAIGVTPTAIRDMLETTSRAWLAEVDGRAVAFSMADARQCTIFAMFVRPGHEGRGFGRALMREAEAWLAAEGCAEMWLLTGGDERLRANGFYQHLRWQVGGIEADGQVRYVKRIGDEA